LAPEFHFGRPPEWSAIFMRRIDVLIPLLIMLGSAATLHATLAIPLVEVGNPGNVHDSSGFGGVGNTYSIGKHEVTNSQYIEFLNAVDPTGGNGLGLYSDLMTTNSNGGIAFSPVNSSGAKYSAKTGRANNPVVFVSWYSALRFANWMHNGQGSGNTETGAYTLLGGTPIPSNGSGITRSSGATWFLPSENEWYKAAYYDGNTGSYFDYPTKTNTAPNSDQPPGIDAPLTTNVGNFFKNAAPVGYDDGYAVTGSTDGTPIWMNTQNYLSDVGAYSNAVGPYGTLDQGGNVAEWTESFFDLAMLERSIRGGHWYHSDADLLASFRDGEGPQYLLQTIGFRIAATAVPEPTPLLLVGLVACLSGAVHYCAKRRRRLSS
jgi:formylglycine-generating enzyme